MPLKSLLTQQVLKPRHPFQRLSIRLSSPPTLVSLVGLPGKSWVRAQEGRSRGAGPPHLLHEWVFQMGCYFQVASGPSGWGQRP